MFPELFLTGYDLGTARMHGIGMSVDDPAVLAVGQIAADCGMAVVLSFPERPDKDKAVVHITSVAFDSTGRIVAHYRKTHCWGPYENKTFTPGMSYSDCLFKIQGFVSELLVP